MMLVYACRKTGQCLIAQSKEYSTRKLQTPVEQSLGVFLCLFEQQMPKVSHRKPYSVILPQNIEKSKQNQNINDRS